MASSLRSWAARIFGLLERVPVGVAHRASGAATTSNGFSVPLAAVVRSMCSL